MNEPLLTLENVTKSFPPRVAVDRVSFEVRRGEIFALLGPNGAGKTTTVRMLVGLNRPDSGRIHFAEPDRRGRLGYLPEDRGLWRDIPVHRTLVHFGVLHGLARPVAGERADRWLTEMGLFDRRNDKLETLSKGNQQRVQFVTAVLHEPPLAILDEPFSGLDPVAQDFFLRIIRSLRDRGTTVVLSAHQMDLVERVADRLLLMNRGRTILSGSVSELAERNPGKRLHDLFVESVKADDGGRPAEEEAA
ncbi:MAG: ATP-binding cassette domain-containing protein [Acidobacteria bacterium]|nr:ATP-binding cassette domain-containing protein [Acidobacteriota bacterium]